MTASGVGVADLPPDLRGFLLEPEGVVFGDGVQPMELFDGMWAHRGTVATSGHPVAILVMTKMVPQPSSG
jgi:hypothetical protein